jgi:hypothetical protein
MPPRNSPGASRPNARHCSSFEALHCTTKHARESLILLGMCAHANRKLKVAQALTSAAPSRSRPG